MILVENRNVLRLKDRDLLARLSEWENREPTGEVIAEQAKTGALTMKIVQDGKAQYLQSKYDPEREAERFAGKFANEQLKHILFIGAGAGYHMEKVLDAHPDAKFSIYEPNEEVLYTFLANYELKKLPVKNLSVIFTGIEPQYVQGHLENILNESNNLVKIITLPAYEKMYGSVIEELMSSALSAIKDKHSTLTTNYSFQKRWTVNSIKNFPVVLNTPNILHDIDPAAFKGKPAIIVAAGPSLNEEFENLRHIKENGLAYIFSVGSAINALVEHGVYPDAICSYDPQSINYRVVKIVKEKNIAEIPLLFGSSVGFETLENYPGKLLHMLISQDTVAPALLKTSTKNEIDFINDAPSIAVVTFQLLAKLQVSEIILVGQNLAFVGNQHYAKGIDYGNESHIVREEQLNKAVYVDDVYGNQVQTNDSMNRMRQQLEMYILAIPNVKVWNTTKNGAAIKGTEFKELSSLLGESLQERVVDAGWMNAENLYNLQIVEENIAAYMDHMNKLEKTAADLFNILKKINNELKLRRTMNLEKQYPVLDAEMAKMKQNPFYKVFIEPMVRVQGEKLTEEVKTLKFEENKVKKGEKVVKAFTNFVVECMQNIKLASTLFEEMKDKIQRN